jgi:tetratricopeptide (TPR) repeat protein
MRNRTTTVVGFALVVVAAAHAYAGSQARIAGRVIDSDGQPIAGAEVTITSADVAAFEKIVTTGKKGEFKVLILDATRRYLLHVEAKGYQGQERPFKVGVGTSDSFFEFTLSTVSEAQAASVGEIREQPGYKEIGEARKLYEAGDKAGALSKFEEAVAARPDLVPALTAIADISLELGQPEKALAAARQCLEIDEESIDCLAIAINATNALGDEAARSEYMVRYRNLNPDDPALLYNSAAVFLNKLDDEGARPLLERCIEADPEFPPCHFEYGMLMLRTGDMEGAKKHLEKYLELAPDGPEAATAQETLKYL